jgi:hypothetical protein
VEREVVIASLRDLHVRPKQLEPREAAVAGERFSEYFLANARDEGIRDYIKGII